MGGLRPPAKEWGTGPQPEPPLLGVFAPLAIAIHCRASLAQLPLPLGRWQVPHVLLAGL